MTTEQAIDQLQADVLGPNHQAKREIMRMQLQYENETEHTWLCVGVGQFRVVVISGTVAQVLAEADRLRA